MRHITLLVILASTPLTTARAQDSLPVTVGARVRVTAPTLDLDRHDGIVRAMDGDTLVVDGLRASLASITRLDVHRGRGGHPVTGAVVGAAVLGAVWVALVNGICDPWGNSPNCSITTGGFVALAAAGAAGGALIGAGIGALIKSDRWEVVPLDQLRVSFVPQRDGRFAFGLSAAF